MKKEFIKILENKFDCLENDLDIVIKKEGDKDTIMECMLRALVECGGIDFSILTDDGFNINVDSERVYYYLPYHTDKIPTKGFLEYNFDLEKFTPNGDTYDVPVFKELKNIIKYIEDKYN